MEHKKSLFEPFQEIGSILRSHWGELIVWGGKHLFNPSPLHIIKGGWTFVAIFLIWQGVQKIATHRQLSKINLHQ